MKLARVQLAPNCLEEEGVYDYVFEESWTREAIVALAERGRLEFWTDFPRPFFRFCVAGAQVTGVEGARSCKVTLPREHRERARAQVGAALCSGAQPPKEE